MKKNPFVSYISKITFLSIIVCFLSLFLILVVPKGFITKNVPYYIVMYYLVTILGYAGVYFLPKKTSLKFENVFLMTKIVKFLIYLLVLVVVFLCGIEKNAKFAITYLVLFLIYQIFDTITLTKLVKKE